MRLHRLSHFTGSRNLRLRLRGYSTSLPGAADPSKSKLPLKGLRVLDLTRVLAGPYCTQILGDLGAEVIKIEHPTRGDDTRAWGPPYAPSKDGGKGESAYFLAVNRNKKSLGLSFKHPSGQRILQQLAKASDILVENYLPGTLKNYSLDYPTLHGMAPHLIYASITGYGQTGPYKDRAGYDVMVEAEMGLMHITGEPERPPVKVGVAVTDLTTGLYCSNSILAAVIARAGNGGVGQWIDVALSDCQVATLANIASSALISGKGDGGRFGTAHPSIVPYESFPTTDGNIILGGGNDRLYAILCQRIGKPEWITDPRFMTNEERVENRKILVPMVAEVTRSKTTQVTFPLPHPSTLFLTTTHTISTSRLPLVTTCKVSSVAFPPPFFLFLLLKYGCVRVFSCYHRNGWRYSTPAECRTPLSTIFKPRYPTPTFSPETWSRRCTTQHAAISNS
ncbi:unnamed protein product [Tuber aestivum]|uniref:Uncharacterized protein n=1 Tax=Tuber aestivum TaxID=59557 RepID=A0A292Q5X3_9PEZI|nr:unnamed protein product [Tuber aestivum]